MAGRKDITRAPSWTLEDYELLRTRVIHPATLMGLTDAWWIFLEDSIYGTVEEQFEKELREFVASLIDALLSGLSLEDLGSAAEILMNAAFDKMDFIDLQEKIAEDKRRLFDNVISGSVLSQSNGNRGYKVVWSRNA